MSKTRRQVCKGLSSSQQLFANAIDWNAFDKAMSNPKSRKEIESVLRKVR